jgi:hypothetical protein
MLDSNFLIEAALVLREVLSCSCWSIGSEMLDLSKGDRQSRHRSDVWRMQIKTISTTEEQVSQEHATLGPPTNDPYTLQTQSLLLVCSWRASLTIGMTTSSHHVFSSRPLVWPWSAFLGGVLTFLGVYSSSARTAWPGSGSKR